MGKFLLSTFGNISLFSPGRCRTNFVCQNGGYIGPDCNCICPYGVSGFTCDEVKSSTPSKYLLSTAQKPYSFTSNFVLSSLVTVGGNLSPEGVVRYTPTLA